MDLLNRVSSLYLSYRHAPCQWSTRPILHGSDIFYFICSRVIIQKSVFRILQGFLYSWFYFSELAAPSLRKFLNYWSSWFILSIIKVFLT